MVFGGCLLPRSQCAADGTRAQGFPVTTHPEGRYIYTMDMQRSLGAAP
jgi:hypothetical protein